MGVEKRKYGKKADPLPNRPFVALGQALKTKESRVEPRWEGIRMLRSKTKQNYE
jgi:hypothetical protein